MKARQLIDLARQRLDDTKKPYLWGDDELLAYLDEAQQEACIRTGGLFESESPRITEIDVLEGESVYPLHPSILRIQRASFDGRPVKVVTREWLYRKVAGWETMSGLPYWLICDAAVCRLVPTPDRAAVLKLAVFRLPEDPLRLESELEISAPYQIKLIDWVLRCAYLKPDCEQRSDGLSAAAENRFIQTFGEPVSAYVLRRRREGARPTVRYGGL